MRALSRISNYLFQEMCKHWNTEHKEWYQFGLDLVHKIAIDEEKKGKLLVECVKRCYKL